MQIANQKRNLEQASFMSQPASAQRSAENAHASPRDPRHNLHDSSHSIPLPREVSRVPSNALVRSFFPADEAAPPDPCGESADAQNDWLHLHLGWSRIRCTLAESRIAVVPARAW